MGINRQYLSLRLAADCSVSNRTGAEQAPIIAPPGQLTVIGPSSRCWPNSSVGGLWAHLSEDFCPVRVMVLAVNDGYQVPLVVSQSIPVEQQ